MIISRDTEKRSTIQNSFMIKTHILDIEGKYLNTIRHIYEKSTRASVVAQMVKNPPAVWETWVQSLGWEDPLEKGMGTHSSILAWRIPTDRGAWRAIVHGVTKSLT